jgi:hypothetical protein
MAKAMWENDQLRLIIRTLRLYRRYTANEHDRREFSRNLVEIYIEEEKMTVKRLREHVDRVLGKGGESYDLSDIEVCEILDIILDKVVQPGDKPRAMTNEEINAEMRSMRKV